MSNPLLSKHPNPWVASGARSAEEEAARLWRFLDHALELVEAGMGDSPLPRMPVETWRLCALAAVRDAIRRAAE